MIDLWFRIDHDDEWNRSLLQCVENCECKCDTDGNDCNGPCEPQQVIDFAVDDNGGLAGQTQCTQGKECLFVIDHQGKKVTKLFLRSKLFFNFDSRIYKAIRFKIARKIGLARV